MKKLLLIVILFIQCFIGYNQNYKTYHGDFMSPVDTLRALNVFINIIYDQCDTCDPLYGITTPNWLPGPKNSININPPAYLLDYMDTVFDPDNIHGSFTRRYAEASFNHLIVLGDHIVVNIAQSRITTNKPNASFGFQQLVDSTIALINDSGGLKTIYGHNNITDYDGTFISGEYKFKHKPENHYNDRIDLIQFFMRNCTSRHGGMNNGGRASVKIRKSLLINGRGYKNDAGTIQGRMANYDLSYPKTQTADVHELAHNILGMTNSAHMGGGGPLNSGNLITLEANSGGWSIIGSRPSSLLTCNGFERWWLNWLGPTNNNYPIAAGNDSSDIEKSRGNKSFYLRDFITYGDVVRIKLPYKDTGALNQYIWLENHQIHNNDKLEYPAYWTHKCKEDGIPGIYAYYQVGKDIRESNDIDDMYGDSLSKITDHLIPVCADGKWDVSLSADSSVACINGSYQNHQYYYQENPFCGYNDLENHYFNSVSGNILNWKSDRMEFLIKVKNGNVTNRLANMGDNYDAFTGSANINMSTNPAPVNIITYHHRRPGTGKIIKSTRTDNRKIHLSGLRIDMAVQKDGIYKVDIRWDNYDITGNVRWTGDIVLHEEVNLFSNSTIMLDQNYTPDKHIRDTVTGVFAGPTYFTCLDSSLFTMQSYSNVILQNLSSFILESGSLLELNNGSVFTVNSGCTFYVKSGADVVIRGSGKIDVKPGGYICIENGANITLQDKLSVINLFNGYNNGVNKDVLSNPEYCVTDIPDYLSAGNY
ncbi:MAG: hypothetical protein JSV22_09915 [Bacteroidales bacterium]|nr:MAG: hypothetical protein JSV22_09915 [Bacteroidales bacterium]